LPSRGSAFKPTAHESAAHDHKHADGGYALGDETRAKAVEQRGIDFATMEELIVAAHAADPIARATAMVRKRQDEQTIFNSSSAA